MAKRNRKSKAQRRTNRTKTMEVNGNDSLSSVTNTVESDNSSLVQDDFNASEAQTSTLSNVCTAFARIEPPSWKQGLLALTMFLLGIYSGISYVALVQDKYGFGKNSAMEETLLPFGPTTHLPTAALVSSQREARPSTPPPPKKQILFNRDNSAGAKRIFSTLFGLDYNSVIGVADEANRNSDDNSNSGNAADASSTIEVPLSWYILASNRPVSLSPSEREMIQFVAERSHETIPDLVERAELVSWGGPHNPAPEVHWWPQQYSKDPTAPSSNEAGQLIYSYLFIMKWNPRPQFPFRLCGEHGCPPERAISHSLEWREKFKPWLAPPSLLEENANGYVYHRGLSPADHKGGKHAMVWLRLNHYVKSDLAFFRGILHSADRAIAESLVHSKGETGKVNFVISCAGYSFAGNPSVTALKQAVTMLQDHYPNRLGMIFLTNLPRTGEWILNIILRLITKEVRDKIKVIPSGDKAKTMAILRKVVDEEYIPYWLGGQDTYEYSVDEYYPEHNRCTEKEAQEFLTTMPYHGK